MLEVIHEAGIRSRMEPAAFSGGLLPVLENGIDGDTLPARHAKRNFAVALGCICPENGFHVAVDAAKEAGIPLFLAGDVSSHAAHAHYWRHELLPRLDSRRRWIGAASPSRKRRLLTAARCVLVPSLVPETISLVAMEALACGTPIIAFLNGPLADIVEPGKTGFLVLNSSEMAEAIKAAGQLDPERCRAAARERFSGLLPATLASEGPADALACCQADFTVAAWGVSYGETPDPACKPGR